MVQVQNLVQYRSDTRVQLKLTNDSFSVLDLSFARLTLFTPPNFFSPISRSPTAACQQTLPSSCNKGARPHSPLETRGAARKSLERQVPLPGPGFHFTTHTNSLPKPQVILVHTLREKETCGKMEKTGRVGQPLIFGLVLNYLAHANPDG